MVSPKEYRLRADECLHLANEATEFYVKVALTELATEFRKMADDLEPDGDQGRAGKPATHGRATHRHAA